MCNLVDAFVKGRSQTGGGIASQTLLVCFKDLFIEPNPVPIKTGIVRGVGQSWRKYVLPLCEMSPANQARFAQKPWRNLNAPDQIRVALIGAAGRMGAGDCERPPQVRTRRLLQNRMWAIKSHQQNANVLIDFSSAAGR